MSSIKPIHVNIKKTTNKKPSFCHVTLGFFFFSCLRSFPIFFQKLEASFQSPLRISLHYSYLKQFVQSFMRSESHSSIGEEDKVIAMKFVRSTGKSWISTVPKAKRFIRFVFTPFIFIINLFSKPAFRSCRSSTRDHHEINISPQASFG